MMEPDFPEGEIFDAEALKKPDKNIASNIEIYLEKSNDFREKKDFESAILACQLALAKSPSDLRALSYLHKNLCSLIAQKIDEGAPQPEILYINKTINDMEKHYNIPYSTRH